MNAAVAVMGDGWGLAAASDRRFRRLQRQIAAPLLALALFMPWLQIAQQEKPAAPRFEPVQVLPVRMPEPLAPPPPTVSPAPAPTPRPAAAAQKAAPPARSPQQTATRPAADARAAAAASGVMAFRDELASLRDEGPIGDQALLSAPTGNARPYATAARIAGSASAVSGAQAGAARVSGSSGGSQGSTAVGQRRTQAPADGRLAAASAPAGTAGAGEGGRTLQELQLTFDRSKSAFFSIFTRAARELGELPAGRIVVSLEILADGSVARCELVSSSYHNAELEARVLQRVRLLNFGAKAVPVYRYPHYPISFLPS